MAITRKLTKNTKNGNLSLQSDSNGNYNNSLTKKLAGGSTVNYNSSGNINTGAFNNSTTKRTPTYLQGIDTGNGSYSASGNYSSGYNNLSSIEKPQYNPLSDIAKPTYAQGTAPSIKQDRTNSNNWQNQLDALYNQISNRSPFNYNQAEDPLYQQYAEMYANNAKLAMQDTVGQVASMTGGYGNSYAETAGQAMYNQQMDNLNQRALDLYNAAENRYINEGNRLNNLYSLAGNQYANAYNAENDEYNRQLAEWQMADQLRQEQNQYNMQMYDYDRQNAADYNDYLMRMYGYDLQNADSDRSFNWNVEQANKDDAFRQAQFAHQQQQDAIDNAYRQNAFEYEQYLNDRDFLYQQNMDAQNRADTYFSSGFATDANGNPTGDYAKWYAEQMAREDALNAQNRLDAQNQFDAELAYKYAAQGLNPDGTLSAAYLAEKNYQGQIDALKGQIEADSVAKGNTPRAQRFVSLNDLPVHLGDDGKLYRISDNSETPYGFKTNSGKTNINNATDFKKWFENKLKSSGLNEDEKDYLRYFYGVL